MDFVVSAFRMLIGGLLSLFDGWPPLATLAPISLLAGIGMLWVFRRVSDQQRIRQARKRLNAHLYELRLFADEPRLIWRAQKGLFFANLRYIALMLRPAVILTIPMVVLLIQLDAYYGYEPLPVGKAALVTVQMNGVLDADAPPPALEVPAGVAVETAPVRALREHQVIWRIRPRRSVSGAVRVVFPGAALEKTIDAGQGPRYLSGRRVSSAADLLWYQTEPRLPGGPVDWIEVRYPPAEVQFMSLRFHWLVWFIVLSMASAFLLRKRFGVTL